jgi:peptidoglycan/LPS O-acetylase OafA/YrhL
MVLYLLFVIGSIGVGCLCYQFVEHPLHRWSRQFFARAKSPLPAIVLPEPEIRQAA